MPMPGARLEEPATLTNAQGVAAVVVHVGGAAGELRLTAEAPGADPVVVALHVCSPEEATLAVLVQPPAPDVALPAPLEAVTVWAFEQRAELPACDELQIDALPPASFRLQAPQPPPVEVRRYHLRPGALYRFVALGEGVDPDDPEGPTLPLAWGCSEAPAELVARRTVRTNVTLEALPESE